MSHELIEAPGNQQRTDEPDMTNSIDSSGDPQRPTPDQIQQRQQLRRQALRDLRLADAQHAAHWRLSAIKLLATLRRIGDGPALGRAGGAA